MRFDIAFLDDETIQSFTSDFGEIARFFKERRLGQNPLNSEKVLEHPREMIEFISAFTQDKRYLDSVPYLEHARQEGGGATMCAVIDAILSEGMEKGIPQGETIKLISMICRKMKKGKTVVVIAEELDEEPEVVERIYGVAKSFAPEYDAREIFKVLEAE